MILQNYYFDYELCWGFLSLTSNGLLIHIINAYTYTESSSYM